MARGRRTSNGAVVSLGPSSHGIGGLEAFGEAVVIVLRGGLGSVERIPGICGRSRAGGIFVIARRRRAFSP